MPVIEFVPTSSIRGMVCIWKGCNQQFVGRELPAGWKSIVVTKDLTLNLLDAEVDGVLCPEHFVELYGLSKLSSA